jgi:hypothetical protein
MLDRGSPPPDASPISRSGDGDGATDGPGHHGTPEDRRAAARSAALRAELQRWMDEVTANVTASTRQALEQFAAELADVEERVLEAIGDLREQISAVRSRVEGRKGRTPAGSASKVDELEKRMDGLEGTIRNELADALFDHAEQAFERRFDALVHLVDARLSRFAASATETSRRSRLLRRA